MSESHSDSTCHHQHSWKFAEERDLEKAMGSILNHHYADAGPTH